MAIRRVLVFVLLGVVSTSATPDAISKNPILLDNCNSCLRESGTPACVQALSTLCNQQFLSGFACQRLVVENDTDTIERELKRLCLPADLIVSDIWSLARFGIWPLSMGLLVYGVFVGSEYFVGFLKKRTKVDLSEEKTGKCTGYVAELVITTAALIMMVVKVDWTAIFLDDFWGTANNLVDVVFAALEGIVFAGSSLTTLYVLELCWNRTHMQPSLKLHHVCSVIFAIAGFVVLGSIVGDILPYIRITTFFILYAATEQMVFIFMLLYRFGAKKEWVRIFKFLAVSYAVTRMILLALEIWATVQAFVDFNRRPVASGDEPEVIVFFILYIPTLIAVSYAQYTSGNVMRKITDRVENNRLSTAIK